MAILKFNDGESFDTSGEPRIIKRYDGLYVLGAGYLIPVENDAEAEQQLRSIREAALYDLDIWIENPLANSILNSATKSGFISLTEVKESRTQDQAVEIAEDHEDDEEIGSSDMTFILKEFLDGLGKKTGFVNNRLTILK